MKERVVAWSKHSNQNSVLKSRRPLNRNDLIFKNNNNDGIGDDNEGTSNNDNSIRGSEESKWKEFMVSPRVVRRIKSENFHELSYKFELDDDDEEDYDDEDKLKRSTPASDGHSSPLVRRRRLVRAKSWDFGREKLDDSVWGVYSNTQKAAKDGPLLSLDDPSPHQERHIQNMLRDEEDRKLEQRENSCVDMGKKDSVWDNDALSFGLDGLFWEENESRTDEQNSFTELYVRRILEKMSEDVEKALLVHRHPHNNDAGNKDDDNKQDYVQQDCDANKNKDGEPPKLMYKILNKAASDEHSGTLSDCADIADINAATVNSMPCLKNKMCEYKQGDEDEDEDEDMKSSKHSTEEGGGICVDIGEEEISCPICLSGFSTNNAYVLAECHHLFCEDCIIHHLNVKIREGECHPIRCPQLHCSGVITDQEIQQLVPSQLYENYQRFLKFHQDPNWRQCPRCNTMQLGSSKQPQMVCPNRGCQFRFCFFHADAHTNSTCKKYIRENKEEEKLSAKWRKEHCHHCPSCKRPIEKISDSCNHMTCRCGYQFCWICGSKYDPSTCNDLFGHYSFFNPFGCPGLQFTTATKARLYGRRAMIVALSPLLLLGVPLYCLRQALLKRRYRSIQRQFRNGH